MIQDLPNLTEQEQQIVLGICKGIKLNDMRMQLGVPFSTLEKRIRNLLKKMDCVNREELIIKVVRAGEVCCQHAEKMRDGTQSVIHS